MATTEPIRDKNTIKKISVYFLSHKQYRNRLLFIMGICTGLRISDLLKLQVSHVYNIKKRTFHKTITIIESKTQKQKIIFLNRIVITALRMYFTDLKYFDETTYLFKSRNSDKAITRTQAYRILKSACMELGINEKISCHSMRKTLGYHLWIEQQVDAPILMEIYNHSNFYMTKKYLGITQDEINDAYSKVDYFKGGDY